MRSVADILTELRALEIDPGPRRRHVRSCPKVIEVSTVGYDPAREGVGSSWAGGAKASRLFVPPAATVASNRRYLFHLCAHRVPRGETHRILAWRQKAILVVTFDQGGALIQKELPITTPDWTFPDGNITTCFRYLPGVRPQASHPFDPLAGPSLSSDPYGAHSALLYLSPPGGVAGYIPPGSGQPVGLPVEGLGTSFDIRDPWVDPALLIATPLDGPGDLYMAVSVWQTNAAARPRFLPGPGFDLGALGPEDRFVAAFDGNANSEERVRYGYVAGAMTIEVSR